MTDTPSRPRRELYKTVAIVAACLGLTTACGLGPAYKPPPPPPVALVSFSSTALQFGAVPVGEVSPIQIVTITSNGDTVVPFEEGYFATSSAFSFTSNCGPELVPHASCNIRVAFNPQRAHEYQASLIIHIQHYDNVRLALRGTGVAKP